MHSPFAVLDFPESPARPGGGSLAFERPRVVLQAATLGEVADVLHAVDEEVASGRHAVGFVAYEAGSAFDPALGAHAPSALPLAWFAICDAPIPRRPERAGGAAAHWSHRTSGDAYTRTVASIRAAIGRGDVYQVNYTIPLDVEFDGDTAALYARLLAAQGPGYGARIHTGRFEILSASPELFIQRTGTRIESKPMKGTARRGRWLEEDDRHANALAASPKERAKNVMIVDLIRNDIGRVAVAGSVTVPRLFEVERRPTVLQMTSTVSATLRPHLSTWELFAALFPCGSVTGAPKVAATRMIAELEGAPRGVYCGAIGHVAPGGDCTFSVAIRTLTIDHEARRATYGVGSGITWDSADDAEFDEVIAKAGILTADLPAFDLIETLRLEGGRYARLERHLDRMERSASYFGVASPASLRAAAGSALGAHAGRTPRDAVERVRLAITLDGTASVTSAPVPRANGAPPRVAIASSPVKRSNRFLFHKTTHRAIYERHQREHPDAFDVLLWNEDGELTEFTIGNVVVEIEGRRWTPPRACGLLAGVFRNELLERGEVAERVLRREDLVRATRMWLINSLREWVEVSLSP